MKKTYFLCAACLILVGCASPYQPIAFTGGYSDMKMQDNVFVVTYRGNGYTSDIQAKDFAMLHCAEVTLQNGYKYFAISGPGSETTVTQESTINGFGAAYPYVDKPDVRYTIIAYNNKEDAPKGTALMDATLVKNNIRNEYKLK